MYRQVLIQLDLGFVVASSSLLGLKTTTGKRLFYPSSHGQQVAKQLLLAGSPDVPFALISWPSKSVADNRAPGFYLCKSAMEWRMPWHIVAKVHSSCTQRILIRKQDSQETDECDDAPVGVIIQNRFGYLCNGVIQFKYFH